ncbi:MAG: septum formation inhibitor Maf [Gammaproteobacteria bacterium]|nr:septum formation inhibitor Maf [Gammaproteobacteria bacterium]
MLHLASRSPRRRELLARLGVQFNVLDVDIPEVRGPLESPPAYVGRVAAEKAAAGAELVRDRDGAVVIGADTEVVLDGTVFGKPQDAAQARDMLGRLSGRVHQVLSAVAVRAGGRLLEALTISDVEFAPLSAAQIAAYVESGEPMGKAGGYAIQGAAEAFVVRVKGSFSGVMGLPLHETARLLGQAGIATRPGARPDLSPGAAPGGGDGG